MIERFFHHRVMVINPAEGDEDLYGNTSEEDAPGVPYWGRVGQLSTEELLKNRDTTVTRYSLRLPLEADLRPTSVVEYEGRRYTVEGEPATIWKAHRPSHLRAILQRVEGG